MPIEKTFLLEEADYARFKTTLAQSSWFFEGDRALYAICPGSLRSGMVDGIALNPEIKVLWRGSFLPWWALPLGVITAAYACTVRIDGPAGLQVACDNLLCQSWLTLLVVSKSHEFEVATRLRELGRHASGPRLVEGGEPGVLACISVDDDQDRLYPVIHQGRADSVWPVLAEFEQLDRSGSLPA